MLWRVHRRTVNPSPRGKHSWFDSKLLHHFWSCHIVVIIPACLVGYRGSIPRKIAKFCGKLSKRRMGKLVAAEQLTRYLTCHKFIIAEYGSGLSVWSHKP